MAKSSQKRLTISDIATMAQTSKTTVSFYLNGKRDKMSQETQDRIESVIQKTGYKPSPLARGLNAKNTHLIGVIVGDITNTFSNRVIKGISSVSKQEDYHIVCSASSYNTEDEESYVKEFISLGVDGFIVQPTAQFKSISHLITNAGKPLVFFDSKLYDFNTSWVKTDNYNATYTAIKQTVEKGYKHFVMISADPELLSTRIERSSGFNDALLSEGLTYTHYRISPETLSAEDIRDFLHSYLANNEVSEEEPTLIFAPNCWSLPTIYDAINPFFNKMPYLGLLGFDNAEWVNVASPAVSTIEQPAYDEGEQACKLLIDQIKKKETENHQVLPCKITWRDTTL